MWPSRNWQLLMQFAWPAKRIKLMEYLMLNKGRTCLPRKSLTISGPRMPIRDRWGYVYICISYLSPEIKGTACGHLPFLGDKDGGIPIGGGMSWRCWLRFVSIYPHRIGCGHGHLDGFGVFSIPLNSFRTIVKLLSLLDLLAQNKGRLPDERNPEEELLGVRLSVNQVQQLNHFSYTVDSEGHHQQWLGPCPRLCQ